MDINPVKTDSISNLLRHSCKATRMALLAFTVLAASPAYALDTGILELAIRQPWEKYASKQSQCQYNAPLNMGYQLQIVDLPGQNKTAINLKVNNDAFVMNRLYQTDIYLDFTTQLSYNAVPLSPNTVQILEMETSRFERFFDGIEEISIGMDETLYVVDLSRIAFPMQDYESCAQRQAPEEKGFMSALSGLNPFSSDETVAKDEEMQVEVLEPAEQLAAQAGLNPPGHVAKEWQPFLTSYRPEPYRLKPQAAAPKAAATPNEAVSEQPALTTASLPAEEKPSYEEVLRYNAMHDQPLDSCGGERVYEFSQIPAHELPEAMQGLDQFMTGNNNADEDKELIQSLLIQLELLEKEKEALRLRAPEDYGALSVIRSCGAERDTISDLKDQLRAAEDESFKLQKQQEIQDEIISAYEGIEGDAPPPAPAENASKN